MICVSISRSSTEPALEFEAIFLKAMAPLGNYTPCWRPGRYELGNFAQYIKKMVGVCEDGTEVNLMKIDLHRWEVPGSIDTVRWVFYADILNAGSTFVRDDLQYVNPVNCMIYKVGAESMATKFVFAISRQIGTCNCVAQKN